MMPPVSVVGAVCLASFVSLLFIEQSYVVHADKVQLQRPIWRWLSLVLLATLLLRYAFRIPWVSRKLLAADGGAWGVECDASRQREPTLCVCLLQVGV